MECDPERVRSSVESKQGSKALGVRRFRRILANRPKHGSSINHSRNMMRDLSLMVSCVTYLPSSSRSSPALWCMGASKLDSAGCLTP
jgi:hypothetical protein